MAAKQGRPGEGGGVGRNVCLQRGVPKASEVSVCRLGYRDFSPAR